MAATRNLGGLKRRDDADAALARIARLLEEFPDARIVYLVRHPADALVSTIGWFAFAWHYFASPTEKYPFRPTIMELTRAWYLNPLRFSAWRCRPSSSHFG